MKILASRKCLDPEVNKAVQKRTWESTHAVLRGAEVESLPELEGLPRPVHAVWAATISSVQLVPTTPPLSQLIIPPLALASLAIRRNVSYIYPLHSRGPILKYHVHSQLYEGLGHGNYILFFGKVDRS